MAGIQAVLTGDLVDSTGAGASRVDRAMAILAASAAEIADWRPDDAAPMGDTRFTRFRGDGWQMLVSAARLGLRAGLMMYARLAAAPDLPATRVSVGIASVDGIPGDDLSDAHGEAFAISGRALAQMERGARLRVAGNGITPGLAAFIGLLDDRIASWTPEQAEAMAHVLAPDAPTQSVIAGTLEISPQALSYRLTGARWPTIRRILQEWENPANSKDRQP